MRCAALTRATLLAISISSLAGCEDSITADDAAIDPPAGDGGQPAPACNVKAPTECSDPNIRYADIEPIIEQRCQSCHDGSTEQWPLTSYSHVASWFVEVRSIMLMCSMPPLDSGITMPVAEREKILLWIRCGYQE